MFFGGVQLLCIGIMGEYVGRIYQETKNRPLYFVKQRLGGSAPRRDTPDERIKAADSKVASGTMRSSANSFVMEIEGAFESTDRIANIPIVDRSWRKREMD